jgi:2-methylcitrate dehydratase PrpD
VRCEHSKGSPENPLTRGEIEDKFRIYAKGRISAQQIEEVIATVARLEDLKSARRLMDLLRVEEKKARASAAA